jgi:sigma-B regulation protein RsbU (phosphoserine phosphatase)
MAGVKPSGVLLSCILLNKLASDTGFRQVLSRFQLMGRLGDVDQFNRNQPFSSIFLLASRQGHLLYPTNDRLKNESIPLVSDYLKGYWGPVFRQIQKATWGQEVFARVRVGSNNYFVMIDRADEAWSTVLILNQRQVFSTLDHLRMTLAITALLSFLLVSLVVQWRCGRITAPIVSAGKALQAISEGNLDTQIQHDRDDEIGALLDNINKTSSRLKDYLAQETSHAITQKQLQTARDIQQDFLVAGMPQSPDLEIAPVFLPAYEVGADWYDALVVGSITYIVVADVCDKGIPSALYMSVFRSLIRYGLLNCDASIVDPGERLRSVITLTNDYMASNHRDSTMFATTFLAAVDVEKMKLYYISGGHEPSLVSRAEGNQWLRPGGPAVGLFAGAEYTPGSLDLQPNDYIVAYTDGLTDARSPEGEGWGVANLEEFMNNRRGGTASAAEVLRDLREVVSRHMADAERFDDLTVMVLHLVV